MKQAHYKNELSAYVDQELARDERQAVAEHLLVCDECRREHDTLRFGSLLAAKLPAADPPDRVWANIRAELEKRDAPRMGLIPQAAWFDWRKAFAFAVSVIAVSTIAAAVYIDLFTGSLPPVARHSENGVPVHPSAVEQPAADYDAAVPVNTATEAQAVNANTQQVRAAGELPSWQVETLAGAPTLADGSSARHIAVGQLLETDARSKAKITVADIGSVEVSPNSRIKLVGTSRDEHRMELERGRLYAKIYAPPRLFVVDTPSGKAVDLGCEYTLEVDQAGGSTLNVTSGFVALEDRGRESIVPAGMMCLTRKGLGLGTPFAADTTAEFRRALEQFDFSGGGRESLQTILAKADLYDMVTLWHLLSRVSPDDRGSVFDKLADIVPPPRGVTRDGILKLNGKMLAAWRSEVENAWFN